MTEDYDVLGTHLYEALKGVMDLIYSGELVRNIDKDADPDWAIRMMEFTGKLKDAQSALDMYVAKPSNETT